MNWQSISPILRIGLLLGAVCYLALILWLLKKKKLTVRYSIIWLISAGVLLVFAVFPYVVLVLTDLLGMAVPVNVVFLLVIAFILLLLLSLSSIVSGFAEKIKRLAQENALLEERVRRLEAQLAAQDKQTEKSKKAIVTRRPKAATACQKRCAFPPNCLRPGPLAPFAAHGGLRRPLRSTHASALALRGVCALRAALSARLPAREASHRSDTRLRAQSPPFCGIRRVACTLPRKDA